MDEKRIEIAGKNFVNYLRDGMIKKVSMIDPLIYETYSKNARESLNVANQLFQNKTSSLWVIVSSYYVKMLAKTPPFKVELHLEHPKIPNKPRLLRRGKTQGFFDSMFYIACAYLYKLGYKAGGEIVHQVVNEALIVQGRHKLKNYILENYAEEKDKALVIVDSYLDNETPCEPSEFKLGDERLEHELPLRTPCVETQGSSHNYERERGKRALFQYETTEQIKESKAQTSLNRAKEFLTLMEEILEE